MLRLTAVAALALMLVIALAAPALARDIVRLSGDVDIPQGEVVDGVVVMNGDITIAGTVTGNAFAANGDIRLLNGARVGGDAISLTGRVITEGTATIGGDRVEVGAGPINIGTPGPIDVPDPAGGFFGFGWIFMSLGAAGLGLFLVLISARSLRSVGEEIAHRPGRSALVGFLSIIGVPVLLVVLMISVIGIPLGLLLIPLLPWSASTDSTRWRWWPGSGCWTSSGARIPGTSGPCWPGSCWWPWYYSSRCWAGCSS